MQYPYGMYMGQAIPDARLGSDIPHGRVSNEKRRDTTGTRGQSTNIGVGGTPKRDMYHVKPSSVLPREIGAPILCSPSVRASILFHVQSSPGLVYCCTPLL